MNSIALICWLPYWKLSLFSYCFSVFRLLKCHTCLNVASWKENICACTIHNRTTQRFSVCALYFQTHNNSETRSKIGTWTLNVVDIFYLVSTEYHHGNMHTTTFYLFFSKTLPLNAIYQCDLAAKCSLCSIRMFNPVLNNIFMSIVSELLQPCALRCIRFDLLFFHQFKIFSYFSSLFTYKFEI